MEKSYCVMRIFFIAGDQQHFWKHKNETWNTKGEESIFSMASDIVYVLQSSKVRISDTPKLQSPFVLKTYKNPI